ncbi:MAG: hypothetical protein K2M00_02260 [Muribaculaceae bacterium]|nr:hypothetical protein [Muribaculaceae bacterium]
MKRRLLIIFFVFQVAAVFANEDTFRRLDKSLSKDFVTHKSHRLDSLGMAASADTSKWAAYYRLASEYASFETDSALHYTTRALKAARNRNEVFKSRLQLASLYNSALMMYKEAGEIFDSLDPDSVNQDSRTDYYIFGVQLYKNLESLAVDESLRRQYAIRKAAFRDSVLRILPSERFIRANELLDAGRPEEALRLFEDNLNDKEFNPANGAMYHLVSKAYAGMGDKDNELKFLALAAKTDIENGVREYIALPMLALRLYEEGDLDRAYRYMQRALKDAKDCKARVRIYDIADTLSVIATAYAARQRSAHLTLALMLVLVVLLLVIVGGSLIYARQRNRLLNIARSDLEKSNIQLAADGNVREKYLWRFMNLSREYLEKLDNYRAKLFKIGAKRNFDALFEAIKSQEIADKTAAAFYGAFDKAFLELYPDFINEFNRLLKPEERIILKEPDTLNTELRIFALMKLGVCESAEIAKFLHCSQSTVYNYRTRYRAKAIDKEQFVNHFFGETTR